MIDPLERWRRVHGLEGDAAVWAGLPSFGGLPYKAYGREAPDRALGSSGGKRSSTQAASSVRLA